MRPISFRAHCALAFSIRILLVIYANFHDKHFDLPYTDVDYKVFTDASRHMVEGNSPYDRHTYRYTPLLALLVTPNVWLHADFGKIMFSLVDVLVAILIKRILLNQGCADKMSDLCSLTWLYNPLTIVISTRGNADSLAVLFVLSTLYLLRVESFLLAGLLNGVSIHFRLYPLAFSLGMYLSLRGKSYLIPNRNQTKLVLGSLLSLLALMLLSYHFYGYKFLYESFIYHLIRRDARHNFSVYFYMLYLSADRTPSPFQKLFTFLPQLTLLTVLSFRYGDRTRLPFAMLAQAMVMVFYNPVMTSQYFFWFLSLLPLCLPYINMSRGRALTLASLWISSQALWLLAAYLLEFQGVDSFDFIWLASQVFFLVNTKVLTDVVKSYNVLRVTKHK